MKLTEEEIKKTKKELEERRRKLFKPIEKEWDRITEQLIALQKKCPHPWKYVNLVGEYSLDYKECRLCGAYSTKDDWS
ncbi:MAG: hypothetical protein JETCAE03_32140 [Ignavibacteriaceae bacterium]|jgi:hypothetical protein|nr:MAG: hypothetical protein JETCAE03_32140 [Ignavibacteriaceae bacterium]